MRRVVGGLLLTVGTCLLGAAVLLPSYVEASLFKIPLDQFSVSVAEAQGATVFSPSTLSERKDVSLTATRRVKSDVKAASEDRVVFDVFLSVEDPNLVVSKPEDKVINATTDRVALDRRTSEAVACCNENYNGKDVRHKGLTYKFPFHTEKKTYDYYDNTADRTFPIRYITTEKIKGLDAYKFQMTVEPMQIAEMDFPGNLLGGEAKAVKAPRYYANTRTIWVEPKTGIIIRGSEEQLHTLRNEAGEDKVTLLKANLEWNDKTIAEQTDKAKENLQKLSVVTTVGPAVLGTLGVLMIIAGIFLVRQRTIVGRRRAGRTPVGAGVA